MWKQLSRADDDERNPGRLPALEDAGNDQGHTRGARSSLQSRRELLPTRIIDRLNPCGLSCLHTAAEDISRHVSHSGSFVLWSQNVKIII